jgi:integrase
MSASELPRALRVAAANIADMKRRQEQYLASLLIASRADIKTVQARMRHASATTTLDTYGHLWPDADESTRIAIGAVIAERMKTAADQLRTTST